MLPQRVCGSCESACPRIGNHDISTPTEYISGGRFVDMRVTNVVTSGYQISYLWEFQILYLMVSAEYKSPSLSPARPRFNV